MASFQLWKPPFPNFPIFIPGLPQYTGPCPSIVFWLGCFFPSAGVHYPHIYRDHNSIAFCLHFPRLNNTLSKTLEPSLCVPSLLHHSHRIPVFSHVNTVLPYYAITPEIWRQLCQLPLPDCVKTKLSTWVVLRGALGI